MVKKILLLAGVALSVPAFAHNAKIARNAKIDQKPRSFELADVSAFRMKDQAPVKAFMEGGSVATANPAKAAGAVVQWKRPAGQFWGVGYVPEEFGWTAYTPLVLRPWIDYDFENMSTVNSTPTWDVMGYSMEQNSYVVETTHDQNIRNSWILGEMGNAPLLSYPNQIPYPSQYYGEVLSTGSDGKVIGQVPLCIGENIESLFYDLKMPVSSHYYGIYTREPVDRNGFMYTTGAEVYEGQDPEYGMWFGTNNSGINAMATRFEKPDKPYLMNSVYFYYQYFTDITKEIPMKAYVFKTVNDAEVVQWNDSVTKEVAVLGELIATSESFIPKARSTDEDFQDVVKFEFFETNPVTGAKTAISLEIEDDVTVVVTGFNGDPGNGGFLTSFISTDTFDEGYGNLGFLGNLEEDEDGNLTYSLRAIKNFFSTTTLHNTTLGVLADVSYPWLEKYFEDEPSEIFLPNDGQTTNEVQGLQYELPLLSTSPVEEWDVTFNGEESCDWFNVLDAFDIPETDANGNVVTDDNGNEIFSGICDIVFEADPNPDDADRTCVVKISIPAATYTVTFRQGTNNNAVEIVGVDGNAQYFDLQGRRVANPDKGIYIKKSGNKATKVIL